MYEDLGMERDCGEQFHDASLLLLLMITLKVLVWWFMLVITALRSLRQGDCCEFKVSLY